MRGSENGRESGSGTERETETGERAEATPTAATPAEHRTENGAGHAIAVGPGAETRTERGNANAAGTADSYTTGANIHVKGQSSVSSDMTALQQHLDAFLCQ